MEGGGVSYPINNCNCEWLIWHIEIECSCTCWLRFSRFVFSSCFLASRNGCISSSFRKWARSNRSAISTSTTACRRRCLRFRILSGWAWSISCGKAQSPRRSTSPCTCSSRTSRFTCNSTSSYRFFSRISRRISIWKLWATRRSTSDSTASPH